jgi:hypothetical protein
MSSRALVTELANDPGQSPEACESTPCAGSFERDTLTWAFAKLAECVLDELFSQEECLARYSRWLYEDAPRAFRRRCRASGALGLGVATLARARSGRLLHEVCVAKLSGPILEERSLESRSIESVRVLSSHQEEGSR